MNYKKIVLIFGSIAITLGIISFILLSINPSIIADKIIKDSYVKNTKWDSTLKEDVSYSIGNNLEFYYILDNTNSGSTATIDLEKLSEKIDIKKIQFGDEVIKYNKEITLNVKKDIPLKISGASKINNNENESDISELIDVSITDKQINEQELSTQIESVEIQEPENIVLIENSFSSNINNILQFSGENLENINYVTIGNISFTPTFKDGNMYVFVEKATFMSGNYFIILQPKNNKIITLDSSVTFNFIDTPVSVTHITPDTFKNTSNTWIILQGDGFKDIISIQLNNNLILKNTSFDIIGNGVLQLQVPKGLTPGKYSLNILTSQGVSAVNNIYFTVTS